jgi:microsomal dipeptidase-like Zn-dependent dipeptidase
MNEQTADAAIQQDVEQQVIDIHCHPALKTWLFPSHHVYDGVMPVGYDFSENCFVNIPNMQSGNVGVGVSVYYLPEAKIETEKMKSVLLYLGMAAIKLLCDRLDIIVEDTTSPSASFEQIKNYISVFENDIAYAVNEIGGPTGNVAIAYGYGDLLDKTGDGKTVFLHSIEGAHALGNAPIDAETLLANLEELFDLGVCQITVGHFFENILVSSSGGIPPGLAGQLGYDPTKQVTYANGYNGDLAIQAIDKMLDLGILIDLVHCHEGAKQMIFARNNARGANKRPLLYAHTGVQEVALKHNPKMIPAFAAYLPTWDDIRQIKDCNGLCGVIFMDYWLTGDDDHLPGIAAVIETIISIRDAPDSNGLKGTYDHIAIGSDMDGFTTIPEDLGGDRMMKDLVNAIAAIDGITTDDIDKICFANYMRVLKAGWGKA